MRAGMLRYTPQPRAAQSPKTCFLQSQNPNYSPRRNSSSARALALRSRVRRISYAGMVFMRRNSALNDSEKSART